MIPLRWGSRESVRLLRVAAARGDVFEIYTRGYSVARCLGPCTHTYGIWYNGDEAEAHVPSWSICKSARCISSRSRKLREWRASAPAFEEALVIEPEHLEVVKYKLRPRQRHLPRWLPEVLRQATSRSPGLVAARQSEYRYYGFWDEIVLLDDILALSTLR